MNWNILGHEWAVDLLKEHVARRRLRHAYLITGPMGVGRRTLALRLVQALNCTQPPAPGEPCFVCRSCTRIERMEYPDLAVVQAEQRGGTLKVDQVRELQHSLALSPYEGLYRVALLLHFEEAHPSAANALLKTLEEPPSQVILLVTAQNTETLLPTIVSRCEVLRLRPLAYDQVMHGLQTRWGLSEDQAQFLAHVSGGCPGYALRMHQEPALVERRNLWLDDHQRLLKSNRVDRFAYSETITRDRQQVKDNLARLLQTWLSLWHDVMLRAARASAPITNLDRQIEVDRMAAVYGLETAYRTIAAVERTLQRLEENVNPRLAMDVLLLDLPGQ